MYPRVEEVTRRRRKKKRESKKTEKMEIIRSGVGLSLLKISSPCAKKCELKKWEKMEIIRSGVGLSPQAISSPCAGERRRGCRKRGRRWKLLDPVLVFPRGRFLLPARVEKTYPCVARSNEATRRGSRRRDRRWKLFHPVLVFPRGRFLLPARVEKTYPRVEEVTRRRLDYFASITSPTPSLLSFLFAVVRCSSPSSLLPLAAIAVAVVVAAAPLTIRSARHLDSTVISILLTVY
ncbi:hypothetical protein BHE74_00047804 [Ensete ventricosum]|nr:hypothetical protein BHE74_00047804 [Ensete ventricosum]